MMAKPVEIFCGTGGVGKTTLATSRAVNLASQGKRILLITIDPAKRLKEILSLADNQGIPQKITSSQLSFTEEFSFDAMLMNPEVTMKRIYGETTPHRILDIITRPYGGMNEIMSVIEVQYQLDSGKYDCIVLDTPPGRHFIDFLNSTQKIERFFNNNMMGIFQYLNTPGRIFKSKGILSLISGIDKVLQYLEKITGAKFVGEFVNAVSFLYKNKDFFLQSLKFQKTLCQKEYAYWFLITSVEQQKTTAARQLYEKTREIMQNNMILVINKSLRLHLESWNPPAGSPVKSLRDSMQRKENRIKEFICDDFAKVVEFPEVLAASPGEHVRELVGYWNKL